MSDIFVLPEDFDAPQLAADDNPAMPCYIVSAVAKPAARNGMVDIYARFVDLQERYLMSCRVDEAVYLVKIDQSYSWEKSGKGQPQTDIFVTSCARKGLTNNKQKYQTNRETDMDAINRLHLIHYQRAGLEIEMHGDHAVVTNSIKRRVVLSIQHEQEAR